MSVSQRLFSICAVACSMAAAQNANEAFAKETTKDISKYDDMCFHCIDDGNLFCADDATAKTGKCYAALCVEQEDLSGDAKKKAKG